MALLKKKTNAASLVEVLVASVLIIIVFTISSLTINNLFKGSYRSNQLAVESKLNELAYLYLNSKLKLPFYESYKSGEIEVLELKESNICLFSWVKGSKVIERVLVKP